MVGRTKNFIKFFFFNFRENFRSKPISLSRLMFLGLSGTSDVATFRNLGGDARLVAPYRAGNYDYAHLASFVRSAPKDQARTRTKDCSSRVSPIALRHIVRADASLSPGRVLGPDLIDLMFTVVVEEREQTDHFNLYAKLFPPLAEERHIPFIDLLTAKHHLE